MLTFLLKGGMLGFAAAAQPGPFQAYLLSQVAQQGTRRTLPAAIAPIISDGPIIALMIFVLREVPAEALQWIQIAGGCFVLYLAFGAFRSFRRSEPTESELSPEAAATTTSKRSLLQASVMNLLNPNPYIFWGTIGGPIVVEEYRLNPANAWAFMMGLYVMLVGGLALFVVLVGRIGALGSVANRVLNGTSVIALAAFGVWQLWNGLS